MLVRFKSCDCATLGEGTDVAIVGCTIALIDVEERYLSLPMPIARPNITRLLLATNRQADVCRSRSFTCSESFPARAVIDILGRSRLMNVNDKPGTMIDSCKALMRTP